MSESHQEWLKEQRQERHRIETEEAIQNYLRKKRAFQQRRIQGTRMYNIRIFQKKANRPS